MINLENSTIVNNISCVLQRQTMQNQYFLLHRPNHDQSIESAALPYAVSINIESQTTVINS